MKILIADDNRQIRLLLHKLLGNHKGWSVCAEAEDGIQAIALAKQMKPDLIVLDLAMPEMNGFEAARRLSHLLPTVPIILHTLYASPVVQIQAKECGIQRVTSKSDGQMLIRAIETAFAEVSHTPEAPTTLSFPRRPEPGPDAA